MASPPVPRGVVAVAARASWLVPAAILLVVGAAAPGGLLPVPVLPASVVIRVTTAAGAIGLVIGAFAAPASTWHDAGLELRHALLGIGLSAVLLVTIGVASVVGALSGREAADELERATRSALRDSPGWNGFGRIDGMLVSASEVDEGTELAKILLRPFAAPYRVLLVSVDNSAGAHEVTIDLEQVTLQTPNGELHALARAELARAPGADRSRIDGLPKIVRVRAGERTDGTPVFLSRATSFRDASAITVRADGSDRTIHGRYFTLAEKRAIDVMRAAQNASRKP
jgi:hypothetical protein